MERVQQKRTSILQAFNMFSNDVESGEKHSRELLNCELSDMLMGSRVRNLFLFQGYALYSNPEERVLSLEESMRAVNDIEECRKEMVRLLEGQQKQILIGAQEWEKLYDYLKEAKIEIDELKESKVGGTLQLQKEVTEVFNAYAQEVYVKNTKLQKQLEQISYMYNVDMQDWKTYKLNQEQKLEDLQSDIVAQGMRFNTLADQLEVERMKTADTQRKIEHLKAQENKLSSKAKNHDRVVGQLDLVVKCSVCTNPFTSQDNDIVATRCHHVFHEHCVRPWLNAQHTCPNCRVRANATHRVFFI